MQPERAFCVSSNWKLLTDRQPADTNRTGCLTERTELSPKPSSSRTHPNSLASSSVVDDEDIGMVACGGDSDLALETLRVWAGTEGLGGGPTELYIVR